MIHSEEELDREIAERESLSHEEEAARREAFWEEVDASYARLRDDPVAWDEELEERRLWEATLLDDLEDDPRED
jgi:hypothetical protein